MADRQQRLLLVLVAIIVLGSIGAAASAAVLQTGNKIHPAIGTTWEFSLAPLELRQIQTREDAPRALLSGVAAVTLKNGKDNTLLVPRSERVLSRTPQKIAVSQNLSAVGVEAVHCVRSEKDMISWKVTLTNRSLEERWIEVSLNLPLRLGDDFQYYDGAKVHNAVTKAIRCPTIEQHKQVVYPFPASFLYNDTHGLAVGLHPETISSYTETTVVPSGSFSYTSRHVIFPGHSETVGFVIYVIRPQFGYLEAINGYYRRFPEQFEVQPGADPRQVGFLGTAGEGRLALHRGSRNHKDFLATIGSKYVTWEWGHNSSGYKRAGDWYGHKELWDWMPPKKDMKWFNRACSRKVNLRDYKTFHRERRELYGRNDLLANVSLGYYVIPWMEKDLVEQKGWIDYVYPSTASPGLRGRWAMYYGSAYHVFPWASPWGSTFQQDMRRMADELRLYAVDFDIYGPATLYRANLAHYVPGWAYDEQGKFIITSVGLRHAAKYVKTLRQGPYRMTVMAGLATGLPHAFLPDGYITEAGIRNPFIVPYNYSGKNGHRGGMSHSRYHCGHKPLYTFNGWMHNGIGDVVPWQELTPEQIRLVYQLHLEDWVRAALQAGFIPGGAIVNGHEVIARAMPMLLDVQSRGWEPVSAATGGHSHLERRRYGPGLNAALVISNPPHRESLFTGREKIHTRETFDSRYLGDFNALPVDYDGRDLDFAVSNQQTTFELDVWTRENRIIVFPAGIKAESRVVISGHSSSEKSADRISHHFIIDSPRAMTGQLFVQAPRDFQLANLTWNERKAAVQGEIPLRRGKNTLEITFASTLFRAPEKELLGFPYKDCILTLSPNSDEREQGTARMIREYFRLREPGAVVYRKKAVTAAPDAGHATNIIRLRSGVAEAESGVTLDPKANVLTITGKNSFETQLTAWRLLRLLDTKYPSYIGSLAFGGGGRATAKMLTRAQLPGAKVDRRRYGTALKIEHPERIKLPDDLDSRLNLAGVFDDAVKAAMTHLFDPGVTAVEHVPELRVPFAEAQPVLDGQVNDAIWEKAMTFGKFTALGGNIKASQQTIIRAFHDGEALFLGIICRKDTMRFISATVTERDGRLWKNDDVELFLAPGVARDALRYPYYQFIFNAIATQYDNHAGDKSWNGKWEVAAHKDKDFWSAEVRIPFDVLEKGRSKAWRFNVGRTDVAAGEYSTWAPLVSKFHEPHRFGILRMEERP